jgi:hypothetical protein
MPSKTRAAEATAVAAPVKEIVPTPAPPQVVTMTPPRRSALKSLLRAIAFLLFLGIVGAAAFFGGMYYQKQYLSAAATDTATPTPTPSAIQPKESDFEARRKRVDTEPGKALKALEEEAGGKPLDSSSPEFLYLYGRALFLSGKDYKNAFEAFNSALKKTETQPSDNPSLKTEILLAKLAAARKISNWPEMNSAGEALDAIAAKNASASSQDQQPAGAPSQSKMTPAR